MLEWVQYPEDTEETRTEYTYDAMYRMAKAAADVNTDADTETELSMSVEYTYTDDYLTQVKTPTTAYDFDYGDFGLRTSVTIGSWELATYHYTASPNFYLEKLDYGNGDKVEYTYDNKGRLICQTYEDGDTVTYQYDNDGALASVTDSATGITTQYFYDFTGRTTKYVETATGYSHSVEYTYDAINNLSTQIETIDGASYTTSYTYDADNRVTSKTTDGITVEYTYDGFGRITQQLTKNGDTTILTETYTFNGNSSQIHTHRTQTSSYDVTYTYTYDDNGNILTVNDGTTTTSYVYDSANQLIEAYDTDLEYAWFWTYDNAGNIQSAVLRDYTQCVVDAVLSSHSYTYGDDEWGDLLTAFDGTSITYDGIGNPTTYDGYTLTWEHGRELATMTRGEQTWEFTYDANGMRTKRTDGTAAGTYEYVYKNGLLTRLTLEETREYMYFSYSEDGIPVSFVYDTDPYYYITNAQGDVVGIQDCDGNIVARYSYDAWGKPLTEFSAEEDHIAYYNPLRYRGYVYDQETGLYYLQSRYYDPAVGRFINGDCYASTGQGFTGNNMFIYCLNNCISYRDPSGEYTTTADPEWQWVLWLLNMADDAIPVVGAITFGVCILLGFNQTSQKSLKQSSSEDKPNSDDIDWEGTDENHRHHIIKGTNGKHLPGWRRMGIDPNSRNAWELVLPIIKEVVDKGQITSTIMKNGKLILTYAWDYVDKGVRLVVTVYIDLSTKIPRVSDAKPFVLD